MTPSEQKPSPDFFEEHALDPLATAAGTRVRQSKSVAKKKAGFYLPESLIKRFDQRFHKLKLDGAPIDNKSALLELALTYALDDLDKGKQSKIGAALKYSTLRPILKTTDDTHK